MFWKKRIISLLNRRFIVIKIGNWKWNVYKRIKIYFVDTTAKYPQDDISFISDQFLNLIAISFTLYYNSYTILTHVYIYWKRIEQYYNIIFNHDNPILTYLYTSNNASYIFNALFKNGTIMVQEWKRDEQPTNIGLPRRITSFFPGHSTFLLGETGLTTVERCFYSKKEKKKRGKKNEKRRASSRFNRDTVPPGKQS